MLDRYCLDCGESVDKNAKKCDYCGSTDIDEMDIDDLA
jgi:RNA polymerase subunit RPABC4/transcription elongation factor Spt4